VNRRIQEKRAKRRKHLQALQNGRVLSLAVKFAHSAMNKGVDLSEAIRLGAGLYRVEADEVRTAVLQKTQVQGV
jgi:hypothetical protein